ANREFAVMIAATLFAGPYSYDSFPAIIGRTRLRCISPSRLGASQEASLTQLSPAGVTCLRNHTLAGCASPSLSGLIHWYQNARELQRAQIPVIWDDALL